MSHPRILRHASAAHSLAFFLAVLLCLMLGGPQGWARNNANSSVQDYTDQVVPASNAAQMYDSPLAAGTLTLQDVLEAHKKPDAHASGAAPSPMNAVAPVLTPPQQSSSTNLMMEQGLKSVLQTTGDMSVKVPSPHAKTPTAEANPAALLAALPTAASAQPQPQATTALAYLPGQEPKNLATGLAVKTTTEKTTAEKPDAETVAASTSSTSASSVPTSNKACDMATQKWEKTCVEAGYPASFVGKVSGETRVACADGALHDFWVKNSCAPASEQGLAQASDTRGTRDNVDADGEGTLPLPTVTSSATAVTASGNDQKPEPKTEKIATPEASKKATAEEETKLSPTPAKHKAAGLTETKDEYCGTATEILAYEAPTKDLCRVGAASSVNGDGPWNWSCTDNDGATSSCRTLSLSGDSSSDSHSANVASSADAPAVPSAAPVGSVVKADGVQHASPFGRGVAAAASSKDEAALACGDAAKTPMAQKPDHDLCDGGAASGVRGRGPWRWTCNAGKHKISCQTVKMQDAACGAANGSSAQSAPFVGLCAAGTPSSVTGDGPWTWSCNGVGGGVTVACAASVARHDAGIEHDVTAGGMPAESSAEAVPGPDIPVPVVTPNPLPKHVFPKAPKVSDIPAKAFVPATENAVSPPPRLSDESQAVTPPDLKEAMAPAPVLQETTGASKPYGGHVTLDPTISTVLFSRGQGTIDPQVVTTLDKLAAVLTANADVRITLIAYADSDNAAPPREARHLSLNRALAIRDYLAGKGVSNSRVDVRAEGVNAASGYPDRVDVKVNN